MTVEQNSQSLLLSAPGWKQRSVPDTQEPYDLWRGEVLRVGMTIHCQCEHCGASLKVKDKLAGTVGKCPKCREKIHIPQLSSDDSEDVLLSDEPSQPQLVAPGKSSEEEEEDAIFGDDFFSMQEPAPRPRYVAPLPDDDDDEEPVPKKSGKPGNAKPVSEDDDRTASGANAASIASSLLSKTGKRNRPEDYKDPRDEEDEGYDFSEIKYLLVSRVLPGAAAAVVFFGLFYWMFSGMMGGELELPELAELSGRVTNNGEGVVAQLIFLPKASTPGSAASGSSSAAVSNPDGTYEVFYKDDIPGLVLGTHEVRINAGTIRVVREVTIEAGSQEISFELSQ